MQSLQSKIKHSQVRIDASTVCQLKCRSCPTAAGETGKMLGRGFLELEDFKDFIRQNPYISHVELSNWGEIFLNKDLIDIIRYAYKHNVAISASNGANLNNVSEEVLEALVKYKFRKLTCSLDGATQETYSIYRVNGNFDQVLRNIKTINRFKAKYRSSYPELRWQFVAFGHNEHEIAKARKMAENLNMQFYLKLSWDDLYMDTFSPIKNAQLIMRETGLDVANREEYRKKHGKEYVIRSCCIGLWTDPQVNYDGRLLGCGINYWDDYGNIFKDGFEKCLNGEKYNAAKAALIGEGNGGVNIPCFKCKSYKSMKETGSWLTEKEIKNNLPKKRPLTLLANKFVLNGGRDKMVQLWRTFKNKFTCRKSSATDVHKTVFEMGSNIYPLSIPLKPDKKSGFESYHLFRGPTAILSELESHASVLNKGHSPHSPHSHKEEELLLLFSGEIDLIFPDKSTATENRRHRLRAGQFVYYPAYFAHTLMSMSETPANYLMFKWHGKSRKKRSLLSFEQFEFVDPPEDTTRKNGFNMTLLFEGKTAYLKKIHCHMSKLKPGGGYKSHVDYHEVVIVVLEGEVETLGKRVGPYGVIFYAAGEPHGMHNPGDKEAKYVVFEFHR